MIAHFKDDPLVAVLAVQTAFEGFWVNTLGGAERMAEKYQLAIPIGHSRSEEKPSKMMRNYRIGGTPWIIIIDKEGIVRYNHFNIDAKHAIAGMEVLKKIKTAQ